MACRCASLPLWHVVETLARLSFASLCRPLGFPALLHIKCPVRYFRLGVASVARLSAVSRFQSHFPPILASGPLTFHPPLAWGFASAFSITSLLFGLPLRVRPLAFGLPLAWGCASAFSMMSLCFGLRLHPLACGSCVPPSAFGWILAWGCAWAVRCRPAFGLLLLSRSLGFTHCVTPPPLSHHCQCRPSDFGLWLRSVA